MKHKKRIAIIDADSIAYKAGWSDNYMYMKSCVDSKICQIMLSLDTNKFEIYIEEWREDKKNFRKNFFKLSNDRVKHPGYKGNRISRGDKPKYLDKAREYLRKRYNAKVVMEYESEDIVIRRAKEILEEDNDMVPIVCYIDKDLLQHPFLFYNYDKCELVHITPEDAILRRYRQVCTGDATDNIPGIAGVGKVTAAKTVSNGDTAIIDTVLLFQYHGLSYDYFIEQYNLIYIRWEDHINLVYPISKKEWDICSGE